ncbi:hypothetical protein [Streptomyces hawaiiensis]|uniref:hypothetical protein n=1 Tax=Streptomyces hawaiiensis TaxID=67305 RepID=UPI00364D8E0C
MPLPVPQQFEVEAGVARGVGPEQFQGGEQALGSGRGQGAVEAADVLGHTVAKRRPSGRGTR